MRVNASKVQRVTVPESMLTKRKIVGAALRNLAFRSRGNLCSYLAMHVFG